MGEWLRTGAWIVSMNIPLQLPYQVRFIISI